MIPSYLDYIEHHSANIFLQQSWEIHGSCILVEDKKMPKCLFSDSRFCGSSPCLYSAVETITVNILWIGSSQIAGISDVRWGIYFFLSSGTTEIEERMALRLRIALAYLSGLNLKVEYWFTVQQEYWSLWGISSLLIIRHLYTTSHALSW